MKSVSDARRSGFTIVELLIVIVVIAILATISIVAYNGVQQRARNAARLTAAHAIYKQLEMYTQQTGKDFGPATIFCIPTAANVDIKDGGMPTCRSTNSPHREYAPVNSNFSAQNMRFSYPGTPIDAGGDSYFGIEVLYFSNMGQGMNGVLRPRILSFYLEGDKQDCGQNSVTYIGAKVADDPLNSIVPASYFVNYGNRTWCALSLTSYTSV